MCTIFFLNWSGATSKINGMDSNNLSGGKENLNDGFIFEDFRNHLQRPNGDWSWWIEKRNFVPFLLLHLSPLQITVLMFMDTSQRPTSVKMWACKTNKKTHKTKHNTKPAERTKNNEQELEMLMNDSVSHSINHSRCVREGLISPCCVCVNIRAGGGPWSSVGISCVPGGGCTKCAAKSSHRRRSGWTQLIGHPFASATTTTIHRSSTTRIFHSALWRIGESCRPARNAFHTSTACAVVRVHCLFD